MDSPPLYLFLILGAGVILGAGTGLLKTSAFLVSTVAVAFFLTQAGTIAFPSFVLPFFLDAIVLLAGVAGLGAWIGVELRGFALRRARPARAQELGPSVAGVSAKAQVGSEAISCPHCGTATIDWWDKLMSGLIGRHCICDNCGKSSREKRTPRLVTSLVFLGALWLVSRIPDQAGDIGMAIWGILFIGFEWRSIYSIPLVPVVDSARWKRIKDVFAWGFVGLILATFVFAAIFSAI